MIARSAALLALSVGVAPALVAQAPAATLAGIVADSQTGRPIAGAVVFLPGARLRSVTNDSGAYRLGGIPPGRYAVRITLIGYVTAVRTGVELGAGDERRLDVALGRAIIDIAGVVVTASRAEQRPEDSPASVAVLTSDGIARRNVITLDQALPFVPGVTFNNGAMDIRGASGIAGGVGSRVLMLLDGHPVLTGDGGEIDFNALPILDVDRVEIVKGAYSALYGSNALGGVVNVISAPIGRTPETTVAAHLGGYDTPAAVRFTDQDLTFQGLDVQHARRFGDLGARLLVARETSDGFKQNGWMSRWLLRSKLTWPAGDPYGSSAYAMWSGEDDGEFFTWRADSEPYAVGPDSAVGDWSRSRKLMLGATLHPLKTGSALVELAPYVFYNSIQNHFYNNQDHHRATRIGANAQLELNPWRVHRLALGADWSHTRVAANFLGRPTFWLRDGALYAQGEVGFSERLRGSLGARLDYHDATGGGGVAPEYAFSPKLGLVFKPSPALSTRVSVGHGYRAPSAIEQFVSTTMYGFKVIPNPDLKGEAAWSGEVGATASVGGRLWLDGALFQSEYRDLIGPAAAPGQPFVFQFQNVQRARVRGLDLGGKLGLVHGLLGVEAAYTYLDAKDLAAGGPLPYRSRHNLTGTVSGLGGLLGLDVRYRSRVDQVLVYPADPRGAITTVDLRLGYRVRGTALQAKVSNLLQAEYVDVMEHTRGAPRSLLVTLYRSM